LSFSNRYHILLVKDVMSQFSGQDVLDKNRDNLVIKLVNLKNKLV